MLAGLIDEIFLKKLAAFRQHRMLLTLKEVPLSETLQKINTQVETHLKQLHQAMMTFGRKLD